MIDLIVTILQFRAGGVDLPKWNISYRQQQQWLEQGLITGSPCATVCDAFSQRTSQQLFQRELFSLWRAELNLRKGTSVSKSPKQEMVEAEFKPRLWVLSLPR
jgi:hypothetical protein